MESVLSEYGLTGLIITVLSAVVVYQNKKIELLYKEKDELQEQRRLDGESVVEKYNASMGDFSQTAKLLLAKLSGDK